MKTVKRSYLWSMAGMTIALSLLIILLLLPVHSMADIFEIGIFDGSTNITNQTKTVSYSSVNTFTLKPKMKTSLWGTFNDIQDTSMITWSSSNSSYISVNNSGVVTAKLPGSATITCTAKSNDVSYSAKCTVKVTGNIAYLTSLTPSASTAYVNDTITWNAQTSGGYGTTKIIYRLFKGNTSGTPIKQETSTSKSFSYKVTSTGDYILVAQAVDGKNNYSSRFTCTTTVKIYNLPTVSSITASDSYSYVLNNLTFSASASGGASSLSYNFQVYRNNSLYKSQNNLNGSSISFQLTESGTYYATVSVSDGKKTSSTLTSSSVTVYNLPSVSSVSVSATTAYVGDTVTGKITASGGYGTLTYHIAYYNNGSRINYYTTTSNTYSLALSDPGTYEVKAYVTDPQNRTSSTVSSSSITVYGKPAVTGVSTSASSFYVNDTITGQVSTSGGCSPFTYYVNLYRNNTYYNGASFTSNSYSFKLTEPGTYYVTASIKDKNNVYSTEVSSGSFTVYTYPSISEISISATEVFVNETLRGTVTASGGCGTLTYCYSYFKDGVSYSTATSTSKTYTLTPTEPGTCQVKVYVKDSNGKTSGTVSSSQVTVKNSQGTMGENVTWQIEGSTLTISGTGTIPTATDYPWEANQNTITNLVIEQGITAIAPYQFISLPELVSVSFPDSLLTIGEGAFEGDGKLKTFTLPNNLERIGEYAFLGCDISSIDIPASVTFVSGSSFGSMGDGYTKLEEIHVYSGNTAYAAENNVLYTSDMKELVNYPDGKTGESFTVPATVTKIGDRAFFFNKNLKSIRLPEGIELIETGAFVNCPATIYCALDSYAHQWAEADGNVSYKLWTTMAESDLEFPTDLTTIKQEAFRKSAVQTIVIPDDVGTVGELAFAYCPDLHRVFLGEGITIANNAFEGSPNVVICGIAGGNAEAYATANNLVFAEIVP